MDRIELIRQRSMAKIKPIREHKKSGIVASNRQEYTKLWNETNRDRRRLYSIMWKLRNPEKRKETLRRYKQNMSPERKAEEGRKRWARMKLQPQERKEARLARRRELHALSRQSNKT